MDKIPKVLLIFIMASVVESVNNKVLLISMDGFRWDYIDQTETPNFDMFISKGVRVMKVRNVFATITFPNHWTMVTGMYEEDHGIVANKMYDPVYDKSFSYGSETEWYNDTEPIWITAVREGKKAASYMWVGNQATYNGLSATKVQKFLNGFNHQYGLELVVDWLATDDMDFATFYMNEPDHTGHEHGPSSPEVLSKVRELDGMVGHLMDRVEKRGLRDKLNIIIASDHGMTSVSANRAIALNSIIDMRDVQWSYISVIAHILPKPNKTEKVYDLLKNASEAENSHFKVYYKEDIPEKFHYSKHRRIQPIVLIAEPGWVMKKTNYKFTLHGQHGFDNDWDDMKSMLIAQGPDIVKDRIQQSMDIISLYPMMCELLKLKTCHPTQAHREDYLPLLRKSDNTTTLTTSAYQSTSIHESTTSSTTDIKELCWLMAGELALFQLVYHSL